MLYKITLNVYILFMLQSKKKKQKRRKYENNRITRQRYPDGNDCSHYYQGYTKIENKLCMNKSCTHTLNLRKNIFQKIKKK